MSKREPTLLLTDICESIEKIKIYTLELTYQQFIDDSKTIDAVIRNFEIIGEAANMYWPPKWLDWFFNSV